jgi:hypothetical protein
MGQGCGDQWWGCLPTSIQPQFPNRDNEGWHKNDCNIGDETLAVCHPPHLNPMPFFKKFIMMIFTVLEWIGGVSF